MDARDDADSLEQRAREERLPGELLEDGLGEEERDGRQGRDARPRAGGIRGADRGQDEEGRGRSGAAPVHQETGRERMDGKRGEPGPQGQGHSREPPVSSKLQPGSETEEHAKVEGRHPRRPMNGLSGQQPPGFALPHPDPVVLQSRRRHERRHPAERRE
jgi:hypothetical protein